MLIVSLRALDLCLSNSRSRPSSPCAAPILRIPSDPVAPLNSDPEALKVREWRHKLQKAFLNQKVIPKEEVGHHSRTSSRDDSPRRFS